MPGGKRVVFRSAITGRFVTERCYLKKPRTTVRETLQPRRQRKAKARRRSHTGGRR